MWFAFVFCCHALHVSQETMRNSVNCEKVPLDNICFLVFPFLFFHLQKSSSFSPECLTLLVEKQIHSISGSLAHFCQWSVFLFQDVAVFTLGNPAWVYWDWILKWKQIMISSLCFSLGKICLNLYLFLCCILWRSQHSRFNQEDPKWSLCETLFHFQSIFVLWIFEKLHYYVS